MHPVRARGRITRMTPCSAPGNPQRQLAAQERLAIVGPLTLLCASMAFVSAAVGQTSVKLQFTPREGLMTDPVSIRVSGLERGARITIHADMHLVGSWESHATFIADRRGEVRLDRQPPVDGTYQGVDPMGLFWAMTEAAPAAGVTSSSEPPGVREPVVTNLRVERDGRTIATGTYRRWFTPADVRIIHLREDGLVGQLFEPVGRGPHPAILVLGGSEGGMDSYAAAAFASRGYAAFLDSGGADTISRPGASTLMGDLLIDRLRRSKHPYPYVHLSYPDAGHTFGMAYLPGPIAATGGGTAEANVKAGADSTTRLFAFLERNLRNAKRR